MEDYQNFDWEWINSVGYKHGLSDLMEALKCKCGGGKLGTIYVKGQSYCMACAPPEIAVPEALKRLP